MRLAEKVFNLFCKSMSARALMICVNVGKWVRNGTGTDPVVRTTEPNVRALTP